MQAPQITKVNPKRMALFINNNNNIYYLFLL